MPKIVAFVQFAFIYGFIFNPWTSFPYTFIHIILVILAITFLHDRSFEKIGLTGQLSFFKVIGTALLLFLLIEPVLDFIVQPLVNKITGEVVDYSPFEPIAHNQSLFFKYLLYTLISAGIGEEVLFRGFLFRQLNIILPNIKFKTISMVLISAILFSIPHLYQGTSGLIVTFIFGLIFATIYVKTNYNLWVTILLHCSIDTFFLLLAYFGHLDYFNLANDLIWGY